MKEIVSWETPPKDDEEFVLYAKKNRMMIFASMKEFEEKRPEWLNDEDIQGWLPVAKEKNFPGAPPIPPKKN